MAINPKHTLGFLTGGYRNVADFKGIELPREPNAEVAIYDSILVGWDAADWEVMMPLLQKGAMPECATLMSGAVNANLATLDPPISPMLWTSIASSTWPSTHGIHGFTELHEGKVRAVRGTSIKVPTLWDCLEASGIPATTVAWWPSHPAKKSTLNGFRISNLAVSEDERWLEDGIAPKGHTEYLKSLILKPEEIPEAAIAAFFPGIDITGEDAVARSVLKIVTHALNVQTMATYALAHGPGGHASIYFDALDHFKHLGMKYAPPKLPNVDDDSFNKYQFIVEAAYRLHDLCLGVLRGFTSEDSHFLLVSDHGFKSGNKRPLVLPEHAGAPALEHRHYGVFIAKGPSINIKKPLSGLNLLDVAPILLNMHGLCAPEFMKGVVPTDLVQKECVEIPNELPAMNNDQIELVNTPEGPLLQSLIDLGYLEEAHVNEQNGRLTENLYYLARSLRAEGRPERAWQILKELDVKSDSPLRYQQLAASLLEEAGQFDELEKLLSALDKEPTGLIWNYYKELVNIHNGGELRIPEELFERASVEERILWGRLMVKAQEFSKLERLLSYDTEESVDLLNLRLRLMMEREHWELVLNDALKSTALVFHQPWVHGALVAAFKNLGMTEEALIARRVQRRMLKEVDANPLFIVTGPPRSGTSLAMRLLAAAGIPSVTDGVRKGDEYNALGYFEHEKIKNWDFTSDWLQSQSGKAIKIVEPLLVLAPWPEGRKVVVRMNRPLSIVLRSQRNLKGKMDAPLGLNEMNEWEKESRRTTRFLSLDPYVELIDLFYEDLIAAAESGKMNERLSVGLMLLSKFTETPIDISIVKAVVEPELRRF